MAKAAVKKHVPTEEPFGYRQCAFGVKQLEENSIFNKSADMLADWIAIDPDKNKDIANAMIETTLKLSAGDEVFVYPDGSIKNFVDMVAGDKGVSWLKDWLLKVPKADEPSTYIICKRSESMVAFIRTNKVKFGIYVVEKYIEIPFSKPVVRPEFVFNGVNIADRKKLYAKIEKMEDEEGDE